MFMPHRKLAVGRLRDLSWGLLVLIIGTETLLAGSNATIEFNRDIRPILSDACFACHGPDEKARQADLRLDIREGAFADRGGTTPVAPGRPADSELYLRLMQANPDERMPPQEEHRQLSGTEIELIKQWILQGGVYEGHWSTEPLPENLTETIDQVIQTDLDKVHLQFSPQAKPHRTDRNTRRQEDMCIWSSSRVELYHEHGLGVVVIAAGVAVRYSSRASN